MNDVDPQLVAEIEAWVKNPFQNKKKERTRQDVAVVMRGGIDLFSRYQKILLEKNVITIRRD
jgi:hypothetical protein